MYDGKYAFQGGWEHPDLTASEEVKILALGELPEVQRIVICALRMLGPYECCSEGRVWAAFD